MKLVAVPVVGLVLGLLSFPVLFASGDVPIAGCWNLDRSVDTVLGTIRTLESGNDYTARASKSSASGAYQFLDSTWGGFGGYPQAWRAPPTVQDAKATEHVRSILDRHGGDIRAVPVVWYIGHLPADGSRKWDTVPAAEAGNRLTPREYQTRWLEAFAEFQADADGTEAQGPQEDEGATIAHGCVPGPGIAPLHGGWANPGPEALFAEAPVDSPHHDYPAWDWMLPVGTPLYAVRGGTVTSVQYWPHNWWDHGCNESTPACSTCGIGVTITDHDDNRWAYCHGNSVHVAVGQSVSAGTQLLSSGNTGRSSGPHLHLQIRAADGLLRCPQPLLRSLRERDAGVAPTALPTSGCFF